MTARVLSTESYESRGGSRPREVRIVHLGLGNFHRAHQAWYTAHASDGLSWGIAAFTGRTPDQAELLGQQDGLYCLVVRDDQSDRVEVVPSLIEVHAGQNTRRLTELLATPAVAIVTITVTEGGYLLEDGGDVDLSHPQVSDDIRHLTRDIRLAQPTTAIGRLLLGLEARRTADAGPLAVVCCDNIPDNGAYVRQGVLSFARVVSADLEEWITANVAFVGTSVDRITPKVTGEIDALDAAGWIDNNPVVTESFTDWILSGHFPGGRPAWEAAGARFVEDLEPWENRKLWLLNGAHSILAFAGLARGLTTVSEAIRDNECRDLVESFWNEAVACLPADIDHENYRKALVARFANSRIEHRLAQIAANDTVKVRYRFAAVAELTLRRHETPDGTAAAVAAWIDAHRIGVLPGAPPAKVGDEVAMIHAVSPMLAQSAAFVALVQSRIAQGAASHSLTRSETVPS